LSDEQTNRLIGEALTNGLGQGKFEILKIECLDAHLYGHAFKYHERTNNITGVYPYRIDYRSKDGVTHSVEVMVKAKPDEARIIAVYQGLLDRCGIKLKSPLSGNLKNSDYSTPNLKEAVLFRGFEARLQPYVPASLGVYIDRDSSYTLRLEQKLPAGSLILDPDDDATDRWKPPFSDLTLHGLADIHARFYNNYQSLLDTGYFFVCDRQVMSQARELWQAFHDFLHAAYGELMTTALARRHQAILDGVSDWYAFVDRQPKTLLYGDVNPQNLAFAKTEDGFQLSVFDWERAVISLPQRDLAEHLIYTLPHDFERQQALERIEIYRSAFARKSAVTVDKHGFVQGLIWMLYDLIINRLPLMMIVKFVAHKRRHSDAAYAKAHRLLSYLDSANFE
jgi:hypothetical protein